MDFSFLRRGFPWFGESDPLAVMWSVAAPADDEDDDDDEDNYSRGGGQDDEDVEDEFFDDDEDDEDDGHDAGDTLWAGSQMRQHH